MNNQSRKELELRLDEDVMVYLMDEGEDSTRSDIHLVIKAYRESEGPVTQSFKEYSLAELLRLEIERTRSMLIVQKLTNEEIIEILEKLFW